MPVAELLDGFAFSEVRHEIRVGCGVVIHGVAEGEELVRRDVVHHPVLGEEMVPVLFFPLAAVSGKPVVAQHYLLGVGELRAQDSQQVALFVVF